MRWVRLLGLPVLGLVLVGCGGGNTLQPCVNMFDIGGGRRMYLECYGVGAPTVVLVSGKGHRADTWHRTNAEPPNENASVLFRTAASTRVCAYDRPNTLGMDLKPTPSDPVAGPATARAGVDDLHALLAAAHVQGPYVIVGHSYGGLIARLYASTYPDEVAGLVLEDAQSESVYARLTPALRDVFEADDLNAGPEPLATATSFAQVTSAPPVRTMPMTILTADRPRITREDIANGLYPPHVTVEYVEAYWPAQLAAQDDLAALFPFAKHVTKTNADHYIHDEQPQLVADSILEVVDAVRR